jgi:hypothetical protein
MTRQRAVEKLCQFIEAYLSGKEWAVVHAETLNCFDGDPSIKRPPKTNGEKTGHNTQISGYENRLLWLS